MTNCDQDNRTSKTGSELCATNQSSTDRQDQPCGGSECSVFVPDTGKKIRKGEQLSSKRDSGVCLFLAKLLADIRWRQGWSGQVGCLLARRHVGHHGLQESPTVPLLDAF